MQKKLHVKKGDLVVVTAGESKSKEGKVLSVNRNNNRAIVEGVNMASKHTKPNAKNADGGIVEMEAPIHVSNLKLINPTTGKPTKTGRKLDEKGKLSRFSKETGEFI